MGGVVRADAQNFLIRREEYRAIGFHCADVERQTFPALFIISGFAQHGGHFFAELLQQVGRRVDVPQHPEDHWRRVDQHCDAVRQLEARDPCHGHAILETHLIARFQQGGGALVAVARKIGLHRGGDSRAAGVRFGRDVFGEYIQEQLVQPGFVVPIRLLRKTRFWNEIWGCGECQGKKDGRLTRRLRSAPARA